MINLPTFLLFFPPSQPNFQKRAKINITASIEDTTIPTMIAEESFRCLLGTIPVKNTKRSVRKARHCTSWKAKDEEKKSVRYTKKKITNTGRYGNS